MNEIQVSILINQATNPLEERIQRLEMDLVLTKQHATQTVEFMASHFSRELDKLVEEYKNAFTEASLAVIRGNI